MEPPFIGVCTTNYNCGSVLERHIESIYNVLSGFRFEYIVVDNYSTDGSWNILQRLAEKHDNLIVSRKRCKRGEGRNVAYRNSKAEYILSVDTDTLYTDRLRRFLLTYFSRADLANTAVKAGGLQGIYPRPIIDAVGGWGNLNCDDWDLTVRIWKAGLGIKIYPVFLGENIKEKGAESDLDFLSSRYSRLDRLKRWANIEIEKLGMNGSWRVNMDDVQRDLYIDMGLGEKLSSERWGPGLDDYTSIRRYLSLLRGKILLYVGIEGTLRRWAAERRSHGRS